jgi:outer membrane protein assembly complex protein YaeT
MQADRFSSATRFAAVLMGILVGGAACLAQTPPSQGPPQDQGEGQGRGPAQGKMIVADILIRGNKRMATQNVMALLKTRVGREYKPEDVQDDVRSLMATKQFGNVEARYNLLPGNRIEVYFFVVDYPNTVEDIVFEGAHSIKKAELETLTGVRKGAPLNPVLNQAACQSIANRLREKGRLFASCILKEGGKAGDKRVVYSITEGPEIYVRDIQFVGNHFVSGPVLKTHINSSERFLGVNLFSRPYIPGMADNDVDKLLEYYRSFGFHDVRVSRRVQWDADSRTVVLVFDIQEGLRYRIHGVPTIVGDTHFPREELNRIVQVRGEDYFNQDKIDKDKKAITDYIGRDGVKAVVQDRVFFTGPGQCDVHFEVEEKPTARVGQIFIVGNTTTRQNVILRQVPLFPGQVLSYPALADAERNLAKLGIFEVNPETGVRPQVTVLDPDSDSPYKDILINVQETRTGSLMFGIGFNSDAGATGSIVLNERNFDLFRFPSSFDDLFSGTAFRGAGQELRLEAVPGTQLQRYTFQFREPFLFDTPYSLTVGGYYYQRSFNEYLETRLGERITVGRKLNQYWSASITSRVEEVGVHQIPFGAPPEITTFQGNHFLTSFRVGATRDTRDSYLRPTEGSIFDIGVEQATGQYAFTQAVADFNRYFTLWQRADGSGRHVLAFHSTLGYSTNETPLFERFYAGGFRSLRGFQFRGVGPDVATFKIGGDFEFLNSLEYQIPVRASDNLYFVAFVDSGTVESKVELKNYRVSTGFGVRFVVPMLGPVPIALDFGFPIVKANGDRAQVFSFWLGFFR